MEYRVLHYLFTRVYLPPNFLAHFTRRSAPWASLLVLLAQPLFATPAFALTNPDRWMSELAVQYEGCPSPMDQTLAQFIFPGTHDSGTYFISEVPACDNCLGSLTPIKDVPILGGLIGQVNSFSEAQDTDIYGQLMRGARVFDLRFFRASQADALGSVASSFPLVEGKFYIHHVFTGPSSDQIFQQIRDFLSVDGREKEVIILNFTQMKDSISHLSNNS